MAPRVLPLLGLSPLLLASPNAPAPPPRAGIPVARVSAVGGAVEQREAGRDWRSAEAEFRLKTGDRLRTGAGSVARIEFPWLVMTAAPASVVWVPAEVVLSTVLEAGRVELRSAAGGEIVKLRAAGTQVRGGGHVVVRRERDVTLVSVLDGRFRILSGGRALDLARGEGAAVQDSRPPLQATLPSPPARLVPGDDPAYVPRGRPIALSWDSGGAPVHLQVVELASDDVVIDADAAAAPHALSIPWTGTFRWRVARRDASGLEGVPSAEGFICVVDE